MTREEAKAEIVDNTNKWHYYLDDKKMLRKIDDIYDDFESRICENCKHLGHTIAAREYRKPQCMRYVIPNCPHQFTNLDFGCNKFERKDDE